MAGHSHPTQTIAATTSTQATDPDGYRHSRRSSDSADPASAGPIMRALATGRDVRRRLALQSRGGRTNRTGGLGRIAGTWCGLRRHAVPMSEGLHPPARASLTGTVLLLNEKSRKCRPMCRNSHAPMCPQEAQVTSQFRPPPGSAGRPIRTPQARVRADSGNAESSRPMHKREQRNDPTYIEEDVS